jgi:peptidoglycan biosynthesis protein MviN/MurJ (putative lipid II flippase)
VEPKTLRAKEVVSIAGLGLTALALVAALWMYIHDGTQTPLVVGITSLIMKGGTILDYWLGSSDSSQKKDAVIAGQLAAPPPPIPPTPPLPPTPPHL